MTRVAIIGGGPNGVITANELLNQLPGIEINIYGKSGKWGHGLVYGENELASSRQSFVTKEMGVDANDEQALSQWVRQNRKPLAAEFPAEDLHDHSYPPRKLVGRYFEDHIETAITRADQTGSQLNLITEQVIEIQGSGPFVIKTTESAKAADYVFLCLGNYPSAYGRELIGHPNYHAEIWGIDFFDQIKAEDDILVVGSGLSSIDVLFGLNSRGHTASVYFGSRNGLLPTVQAPKRELDQVTLAEILDLFPSGGLSLEAFEQQTEEACQLLGGNCFWDSLTPGQLEITEQETPQQTLARILGSIMPEIWASLTIEDRQQFDRQHNAVWNALHLPMAQHSATMLQGQLQSGRLKVKRLSEVVPKDNGFVAALDDGEHSFDRVVNATGRNLNVETIQDPLIENILSAGLLRAHPLGGFDVDSISSRSGNVFVIGPLTRGVRFYTYVLAENARQIQQAVESLAAVFRR